MVVPKKSLEDWLKEQEWPTSEEAGQFEAERKAQEGTMLEWAQMQPNGDIGVHVTDYGPGGRHGIGGFVVKPQDEDYEKAKQEYGLEKPGDTRLIKKRWIDNQWVIETNEKIEAPNSEQGHETSWCL
jgi:hypothetical protein